MAKSYNKRCMQLPQKLDSTLRWISGWQNGHVMSHNTARQRQELRYPGAPVLDFIYEDDEPNYFIAGILASELVSDTLRILFLKTFRGYLTTDDREPFERTVEYIASMAKGRLWQRMNIQSMML